MVVKKLTNLHVAFSIFNQQDSVTNTFKVLCTHAKKRLEVMLSCDSKL